MKPRGTLPIVALTAVLAAAACGSTTPPDTGLRVIASTSIIGDIAANVVGDAAVVEVLIPPGSDPHSFQASARQAAGLTAADLVIVNGLGLEESLQPVLEAAVGDGANVLELGPLLDPLPLDGEGTSPDPHIWLDPVRMADAASAIAAAMASTEPGEWTDRAAAYRRATLAVNDEIETILGPIPPNRRKLVTNHDSLRYFADRYGFEIIGVVIPGGTSVAAASGADLDELVATIAREGVTSLFTDVELPGGVASALAAEVGGSFALVPLYTGSLGPPGSGAETYLDMLLVNARRIAAALGE